MQPANLRSEATDHGSSKMAASNSLILFQGLVQGLVICHHGLVVTWHFSHHGGRGRHPFFQQVHSSGTKCENIVFPRLFVIVVALSNPPGVGRFRVPVIVRALRWVMLMACLCSMFGFWDVYLPYPTTTANICIGFLVLCWTGRSHSHLHYIYIIYYMYLLIIRIFFIYIYYMYLFF